MLLQWYCNFVKRFLIILFTGVFLCNSSFAVIKGKGEVKMSQGSLNHFVDWIKLDEKHEGRRCKPSMFILSEDGEYSYSHMCCYSQCQDSYSNATIKKCERVSRVLCAVFSIRRVIIWDNGINRRAKIRSNWSHQEIKTELIRLGFFE